MPLLLSLVFVGRRCVVTLALGGALAGPAGWEAGGGSSSVRDWVEGRLKGIRVLSAAIGAVLLVVDQQRTSSHEGIWVCLSLKEVL